MASITAGPFVFLRIGTGDRSTRLPPGKDRKSTRLNSSHSQISYAVFCLKKKKNPISSAQPARYQPTENDSHNTNKLIPCPHFSTSNSPGNASQSQPHPRPVGVHASHSSC